MTLHDVLYVPDLSHHLISVPQLNTQSRCSVTFFPLYVIFQDLLTREIIGRGYLRGRLFHLDCMFAGMKPEKAVQAALISTGVTNQVEELWLWHRRLGHPSFSVMKKSMPSLFLGIDESKLHCESCVLAKSHRTSYPLSTTRSSFPFELIHSDVWGPSRESTLSGKHWFVLFIDDYTRLTWVALLKHKYEVFSAFQEFFALVQNQFGANIKVFRSDNGGGSLSILSFTNSFNLMGSFIKLLALKPLNKMGCQKERIVMFLT